jgi:hypothetical protein
MLRPGHEEVRVTKYATLAGYEQNREWNVHRWCSYYGAASGRTAPKAGPAVAGPLYFGRIRMKACR